MNASRARDPKSILITGCSSGIGLCLARGLRDRGYRVFASARADVDVDALKQEGFESIQLDLASSNSIKGAAAEVTERTRGRLYALINNGAYGQPGAVEDLTRHALRLQFETNVFGTLELTNQLLPVFRAQNAGRILHISSILGLLCLPYRGAYSASKFALEAFADTMRLELRNTGIHVALIEPGPITTRFRDNAYAAFKANIDRSRSAHQAYYARVEQRLGGTKPLPFTLPPEAVLAKVVHALEAKRPRLRYAVTFPTYVLGALKRLLPGRWMDRVLYAVSGGGKH